MTRLLAGALALGIAAVCAGTCLAHGARCGFIEGAAAIEACYDNGSPMAFCDVEVFRPGDDSEAFQLGTTDCHGTFGFVPDTTGTWRVIVDDGMGHMATAELVMSPDSISSHKAAGEHAVSPEGIRGEAAGSGRRLRAVIMGVALIFGLFGILALFYRRRKERC